MLSSQQQQQHYKQQQPFVVSAFLPRQTGWLQLSPGESALDTQDLSNDTHLSIITSLKFFQSHFSDLSLSVCVLFVLVWSVKLFVTSLQLSYTGKVNIQFYRRIKMKYVVHQSNTQL